jgi:hypothetical protein
MYDPQNQTMVPVTPELQAAFDGPEENLTPTQRLQRTWTQFQEGEKLNIKGVIFRIHEIGPKRVVLKFD